MTKLRRKEKQKWKRMNNMKNMASVLGPPIKKNKIMMRTKKGKQSKKIWRMSRKRKAPSNISATRLV